MKKIFFCVTLIFQAWILHAQDPHFSQYFASPLTLNPALTGYFDGDYRVAINERSQWRNVGKAYNTTSISADFKLGQESIPYFDTFGIGFSGVFDQSLNGALQSNYFAISSAYHKSLAADGRHVLALGFQANFANRFIDYNKLSFASQFNIDFFDPTIPVNINQTNSNTKYFEINAGILYSLHIETINFYVGASLFHGTKPNETIFNASGNIVPIKKTFHAGGEWNFSERSSVLFSSNYSFQSNFNDQLIGAAYALKADDPLITVKGYLGLWYRSSGAYIPYLGLDYGDFNVGVNYSLPTGTVLTYRPTTFEISLIYKRRSKKTALCPRF